MRIVVVFPEPLGPRNPTISPRFTVKLMFLDGQEAAVVLGQLLCLDHHLFCVYIAHVDVLLHIGAPLGRAQIRYFSHTMLRTQDL